MKHWFLLYIFLAVCSPLLYGQDNVLINSKHVSDSIEKTNNILRKNKSYTSVDFVDINLDKILKYEEFLLQIDRRSIPVKKERIEVRGINDFVFVGSNSKGCRILLSVLDSDIQGVVETGNEVYTIETIAKQEYALVTVDYSMLREGCDNLCEDNDQLNFDDVNIRKQIYKNKSDENATSSPILKTASANDYRIRVLVMYTQNAQSQVSSIRNTIHTAVALTNQSFVNSQINYQIELVYAGLTNYTESEFYTDLTRFRVPDDGYMDEVHTLRNKYSADICVLLINDSQYCGVASGIGVTEDNAFCVVSTFSNCATTNYSFGHEIGHLVGCRHDPYVDSNTTPFAYGHGYVHPSNSWRTIMAYGSCPRLLYWSNPNVIYNGAPMGTSVTHNNTRVWNERSNEIIAFRQPDNNAVITSGDVANALYADVIAKQDITTNGIISIENGNTLNMRAGNSISLQPGFSVQLGAEISVKAEDIGDCEECTPAISELTVQNVSEEYYNMADHQLEKESIYSYIVSPNTPSGNINIKYSLGARIPLSIELVDLLGQTKKTILPKQYQQAGNHVFEIPVYDLPTGTYFLTLSSNNKKITKKILVNKQYNM